MKLSITRKGANTRGTFAPRYTYTMHVNAWRERGHGYISYHFETNSSGKPSSEFIGCINPNQFDELAALMVRAHSQAAIRAFGRAIKDIEFEEDFDETPGMRDQQSNAA